MDASTSTLRRQLWRQFRASGRLLRLLTAQAECLPGSFYLLRRKCGKPSCRCAQGHLHTSWVLTRSESGKHKLYPVPPEDRARVRKLAASWKRSQKARAKLIKLNAQLLALADEIVQRQQFDWPPP
ncbi:MAG TPA: DUF6788 family protein [Candidatus Binatia bacterium]|nr:DUF6788 family protein [Candidatus Binatia bacterium]